MDIMEIINLKGQKREYIRPTWLTGRGWDRLVSLLSLCSNESDMDMILHLAENYIKKTNDENLDNLKIQFMMHFGTRFFMTSQL